MVKWDHTLPPNQRIKSIHTVKTPTPSSSSSKDDKDEEDEDDDDQDMVNFIEQEDGTRVEVNQKKVELGEEVKRDSSKTYRVVSPPSKSG